MANYRPRAPGNAAKSKKNACFFFELEQIREILPPAEELLAKHGIEWEISGPVPFQDRFSFKVDMNWCEGEPVTFIKARHDFDHAIFPDY